MKKFVLIYTILSSILIPSRERLIFNKYFPDKFTGLPVLTKEISQPVCDKLIDDIIYFKHQKKIYKRIYKYLTPEMFGAVGDGKTDDYIAIQTMLNKGEVGCTFWFDGSKTYYNAFANSGKWIEPLKRNIWQRSKAATFLFNGAKLRRRLPEWSDRNLKNDYNTGAYYTDDHSALLYLTGKGYKIDQANFSSGLRKGPLLDEYGKPTTEQNYAVGTCMDMGLWLENCENVSITNSRFTNSVFPIYARYSKNVTIVNAELQYAAQAGKRIHSMDRALGGGIKLEHCEKVILKNIQGYRNLNDTVEIEAFNKNIKVEGKSSYDYSNSLVVLHSQEVQLNWKADHIISGSGVLVKGGNSLLPTQNISGTIFIDGTSWAGVLLWLPPESNVNMHTIQLSIKTQNTGYTGLYINNESSSKNIGINIVHNSSNDGTATGVSRIVHNQVQGTLSGKTTKTITGVRTTGTNDLILKSNLSFDKNVQLPYEVSQKAKLLR